MACPPVRSPLALVNPVCSVVVGVVIGEREGEERESQLSRWLPLQGTCVKIAIHQQPIPSIMAGGGGGRRRASRADPTDCEESRQWGTHLLNVADPIRGKSPWEIGNSPPSSSTSV